MPQTNSQPIQSQAKLIFSVIRIEVGPVSGPVILAIKSSLIRYLLEESVVQSRIREIRSVNLIRYDRCIVTIFSDDIIAGSVSKVAQVCV